MRAVACVWHVDTKGGYQCDKNNDQPHCDALRNSLVTLDYDHHQIPKPDLSLFLDVPCSFTQHKLTQQREGDDRTYLNGKQDIHEASLSLQERVRQVYLQQADLDAQFRIIACASPEGEMLQPQQIFQRIEQELQPIV